MKERPILFSAPMVRALLDGTKTQTRRVVKFPERMLDDGAAPSIYHGYDGNTACFYVAGTGDETLSCKYGKPGDRLWVRENFHPVYAQDPNYNNGEPIEIDYAATYVRGDRLCDPKWKPSIHMPRNISRITLEIVGVRVERLRDISANDAAAEGVRYKSGSYELECFTPHARDLRRISDYRTLWESINGFGSWDENPWVWVVEFKMVEK